MVYLTNDCFAQNVNNCLAPCLCARSLQFFSLSKETQQQMFLHCVLVLCKLQKVKQAAVDARCRAVRPCLIWYKLGILAYVMISVSRHRPPGVSYCRAVIRFQSSFTATDFRKFGLLKSFLSKNVTANVIVFSSKKKKDTPDCIAALIVFVASGARVRNLD